MQELQTLPPEIRRGIARRVADEIGPLLGKRAADAVRELRRRAQDERWRLLSQGIRSWSDARFGPVVLSEQWAIAELEILDGAHPIREILAERRLRAIDFFLRDSLPERSDDAA
jgi:lauroyl/myristoyl acyltransferase